MCPRVLVNNRHIYISKLKWLHSRWPNDVKNQNIIFQEEGLHFFCGAIKPDQLHITQPKTLKNTVFAIYFNLNILYLF